ncbi:MAG: DUF664 domain-containing protein [Egibacteraceae bacterium]
MATPESTLTGERGEIPRILAEQRNTLLITVREITDAQAAERTTVSELTLGGLIKHVTRAEEVWGDGAARGTRRHPASPWTAPTPPRGWGPIWGPSKI